MLAIDRKTLGIAEYALANAITKAASDCEEAINDGMELTAGIWARVAWRYGEALVVMREAKL